MIDAREVRFPLHVDATVTHFNGIELPEPVKVPAGYTVVNVGNSSPWAALFGRDPTMPDVALVVVEFPQHGNG